MFWTSYAIMAVGMALMVKPIIDGSATGGAVTPMQIAGIVVGIVGLLVYAMVPNKTNSAEKKATEPEYTMPQTQELKTLIWVFKNKGVTKMVDDDLKRLNEMTNQANRPQVDKEIYAIHSACSEELFKRRCGSSESQRQAIAKPENNKGYAPANPNATLNRAALDTTPDKVKEAQRKAGLRCPKCDSTDVTLLNNTSKSISAGKALIGAETFGLEGMVVGAAMGKKGKREYLCNHCGKRYSVRN